MNLADLKPLNTDQYDNCRKAALERVTARIGDRPTRQQFQRELGPLWSLIDVLALIIFLAALVISSLHIMEYITGAVGERGIYTTINQVGYIFLAEASMVLFMVMHNMTAQRRAGRPAPLRPVSVHLALALLAAVFIFAANLASGVGVLLSIMPPVFTVGIAFNLERLIVASIRRRNEINERYLAALRDYELASRDPESHPLFTDYFMQALWDKLASLKPNRVFVDAPAPFKVAACHREMQRERWMHVEPDASIEVETVDAPFVMNGHQAGAIR
jgi:hypothetical protein